MNQSGYFVFNDRFYLSGEPVISPNNRSFKFGDGFFETMKWVDGNIIFRELHFERLFSSFQTMQFAQPSYFTKDFFLLQIQELVAKNNHPLLARIRLTVFRGDGGLYDADEKPDYIIQSWRLPQFPSYNERGLNISMYKDARKTTDSFSHIKSNNYLPYAMAALWCKKNNFDDALITNCDNRIVEATTANLFIIKDGVIKTPALTEGCVAGVTRRYLLDCFRKEKAVCYETSLSEDDILNADEIFFTNSGWHIQWIKQYGIKFYTDKAVRNLHQQFIAPLFSKL